MPDLFTRFFNVAGYYIERGTMDAAQAQQSSNLFLSGVRPDGVGGGRNLFPFLGSHRVSSVFLEPVSAGNFGVIVFGWALVRSLAERRAYWLLFVAAFAIVVLADSRYGAYFCIISLPLVFCPASIRFAATAVLPVFGLATILLVPDMLPSHYGVTNGFVGRIIMANEIFDNFNALSWFGLSPAAFTADSGYAYAIAGAGLIGVAGFWLIFLAVRGYGTRFALFRDLTGAYLALLLCISNSPFTIKTGALLWFLMGTLSRPDRVTAVRPRATRYPFVPAKAGTQGR
jgi:putative polymerase